MTFPKLIPDTKPKSTVQQMNDELNAAIETVVRICSSFGKNANTYISRHIDRSLKVGYFVVNFNKTELAKHLGLVFTIDEMYVCLCGHRVDTVDDFLIRYNELVCGDFLTFFNGFTIVDLDSNDEPNLKKVKLSFGEKNIIITIKSLTSTASPGYIMSGSDIAIDYGIEADIPIKEMYFEWKGISGDQKYKDTIKISLLEYINFIYNCNWRWKNN